jgi:uncharacterized protein YqeY
MSVLARLQDDMKSAMKAGQKQRLGVIRMLIADVKVIDLAPKKTTEEEAVAAYAKRLPDEAATIRAELAIVQEYLPKKASAEETEAMVDEFLSRNSFTAKQIGPAMGAFMKEHGGKVEAGVVNGILRRKLV